MKKSLSFLAAAATATVVLLSIPSAARAQVAFGGTFRGPHGALSIGVGGFVPQVGAYLPSPYYDEVYERPDYGYGFYYDSQWIPCERVGSRWVIVDRSGFYQQPIIYGRNYGYRQRFVQPYRDYGYVRPFRDNGRSFGRREFDARRDGRRGFDARRDGRRDDGRRDGDRRSNRDNRSNWDGRR